MKKWALAALLAALLATLPTTIAAATDAPYEIGTFPTLFNTASYRNDSLDALPQWRRVLQEIDEEKAAYLACAQATAPCMPRVLLAWQAMIKGQAEQAPLAKLRAVNQFVNQWRPRSDVSNFDQADFWSSPLTFLRRSGDCEDYAIIKYVSLRQMGFDPERLRIVIVRDRLRDVAHAVLAAQVGEDVYILDNLFKAVLPQRRVRQYQPYYSVNEHARWTHLPADRMLLSTSPWTVMPSAYPKEEPF